MESENRTFFETFKPLILIGLFLVGTTALVEVRAGSFDLIRAMNILMGGFFLFFSFFKFLNLSKFAKAFAIYDVIGSKSRAYGLAYPFIELFLGIGFILGLFPVAVNLITAFLMAVGIVGVGKALMKNQTIQCACLGTVFNLPMTKVTLFENTLMLIMSLTMLGMTNMP